MKRFSLFVAGVLLAGCSSADRLFTNRSIVRETIVQLPAGDEIYAQTEAVEPLGSPVRAATTVVWRRVAAGGDQGKKQSAGDERTLQVTGDLKDCPSPRAEPRPTVHVAADGSRAWLSLQGQVSASFDYNNAKAYFGKANQPSWVSGADAAEATAPATRRTEAALTQSDRQKIDIYMARTRQQMIAQFGSEALAEEKLRGVGSSVDDQLNAMRWKVIDQLLAR